MLKFNPEQFIPGVCNQIETPHIVAVLLFDFTRMPITCAISVMCKRKKLQRETSANAPFHPDESEPPLLECAHPKQTNPR